MTDTTAGRGGVGIRIFIQGGEVVRRGFDQIADSGRKMWAEIALGQRSANPAIRALSMGVGEVKQGITDLTTRAGSAGVALAAFGVVGVALAATLGAIAVAAGSAHAAMADAADLTDQADRIGVGVEKLQQWRFAADEAGVGAETFYGNLEKLNGSLGAFKLGVGDGKLKPIFEELGITQDQLVNVRTADDLMLMLADTLGQVGDRAAQVRLARGLGIEDSLPILRMGSERIRELWEEAETLGVVLDQDTIKRLDEADRQMEITGQQMDVLRTLAVAPLAEAMADATSYVAGFAVEFSRIEGQAPKWIQTLIALGRAMPGTGGLQRIGEFVIGRTSLQAGGVGVPDLGTDPDDPMLARETHALSGRAGYDLRGHTSGVGRGGGGASRAAAEAERRQRERERALDTLQRAELDAQRAAIQARYGSGGIEENALELALANITIDLEAQAAAREALRAQLEKAGALDDAAQVRLDELRIAQEEHAAARDAQALAARARELAEERVRAEEVAERDAIELLQIQADMAGTARERYEIGRRIVLAELALERKLLEAQINADGKVTGSERSQLADQARNASAELALFDHDEQERLRDQFNSYGREVVQAIEDGRIGEYIGDRIKERLLDGALNALFNMMGNGGGGQRSGGGFLSGLLGFGASLLSGGTPVGIGAAGGFGKTGRAPGGDVRAGFAYRMAEHGPELLMLGGQGQVTSAAETAKMVQDLAGPGGGSGGDGSIIHEHHYHNDFKGAVMTQQLLDQMNGLAQRAEASAVRTSLKASARGAQAVQSRIARLGTSG